MHLPRGLVNGIPLTSLLRRKFVFDIFVGDVVNFFTHALMDKNVLYPQRDCSMPFRQLNVLNYIKYQGPAEYVMKQIPSTVIQSGVASI